LNSTSFQGAAASENQTALSIQMLIKEEMNLISISSLLTFTSWHEHIMQRQSAVVVVAKEVTNQK